ncbi:hypothetical protein [Mesorhizobium sp. B4-1-3]|uniref:hypothetical protein n=1 Tax=Mesorhizobium sp. B4-1-3 TaxID=2589889 RepID=UPI001FF01902|nr:hypothetical protein [Mesorhizobium sp. B4-1-3]
MGSLLTAHNAVSHADAQKLISKYESPVDAVEALMAYNCDLEAQILAIASISGV